jgi:hypothetical protein
VCFVSSGLTLLECGDSSPLFSSTLLADPDRYHLLVTGAGADRRGKSSGEAAKKAAKNRRTPKELNHRENRLARRGH